MSIVATFSIAARCSRTGMLGVGVASRFLAAGAIVPHVRAGAGAIATQAMVNPLLGVDGLQLLSAGHQAPEALERLIQSDGGAHLRQLALVDSLGLSAAYTGSGCLPWAGHRTGPDYAVAGNMLAGPEVVREMEAAFLQSAGLPLEHRLLQALEAGEDAGGDKRGKQAAALFVVNNDEYPHLSLRVDDHPDPLPELRRLLLLSERTFALYRSLLPTRSNPAGVTDPDLIALVRERVRTSLQ